MTVGQLIGLLSSYAALCEGHLMANPGDAATLLLEGQVAGQAGPHAL